MFVNDIRQQIDRAIEQERKEPVLARHLMITLESDDKSLPEKEIQTAVQLATQYIHEVPSLLEHLLRTAEEAGEIGNIGPLLEGAAVYFLEPQDYIPDHIGLYGLLDDAYLTNRLLESLYIYYERETGLPLMPANLHRANRLVRVFLGEDLAERLDAIVSQAVQQRLYEISLRELASHSFNGGIRQHRRGNGFEDQTTRFFASNGVTCNVHTEYIDRNQARFY